MDSTKTPNSTPAVIGKEDLALLFHQYGRMFSTNRDGIRIRINNLSKEQVGFIASRYGGSIVVRVEDAAHGYAIDLGTKSSMRYMADIAEYVIFHTKLRTDKQRWVFNQRHIKPGAGFQTTAQDGVKQEELIG